MGAFWQGFVAGGAVILLPSLIYLAALVQRAGEWPDPALPRETEAGDKAKAASLG